MSLSFRLKSSVFFLSHFNIYPVNFNNTDSLSFFLIMSVDLSLIPWIHYGGASSCLLIHWVYSSSFSLSPYLLWFPYHRVLQVKLFSEFIFVGSSNYFRFILSLNVVLCNNISVIIFCFSCKTFVVLPSLYSVCSLRSILIVV